ncbi:rRNA-processing protein Fyv7p [Diutina catenulata]
MAPPRKRPIGREAKTEEIKRALTHRARIRKNYFKLLEKEGYSVPPPPGAEDKQPSDDEAKDDKEDATEDAHEAKDDDRDDHRPTKHSSDRKNHVHPDRKRGPLNYEERARRAKQRKQEQRQQALEHVKYRREQIATRDRERERKKERVSMRTKSGQPKMGPRITNLLDKIRNDQ